MGLRVLEQQTLQTTVELAERSTDVSQFDAAMDAILWCLNRSSASNINERPFEHLRRR